MLVRPVEQWNEHEPHPADSMFQIESTRRRRQRRHLRLVNNSIAPATRPDSYPGLRPPSPKRDQFTASIKSKLLHILNGLLIGMVAASGLLVVRVLNGGTQAFLPRLFQEISTHPSSYAYVVLACGWTMVLAAWWFGRRR